MNKSYLFIILFISSVFITKPADNDLAKTSNGDLVVPNTFNEIPITETSIIELAPQCDKTINTPVLNEVVQDLSRSHHVRMTWGEERYESWVAHPTNMAYSGMHTLGASGKVFSDESYLSEHVTLYKEKRPKTLQTASVAAYNLIIGSKIEEQSLKIKTREVYLYLANKKSADDTSAVILRQTYPSFQDTPPLESLRDYLSSGKTIEPEQLRDFCRLNESVGYWNFSWLALLKKTNEWIVTHAEQPNNFRTQDFLLQDEEGKVRYRGNIACGYCCPNDGLIQFFKDDTESLRVIAEHIDKSDIVRSEQFVISGVKATEGYQNQMLDFVKQTLDS